MGPVRDHVMNDPPPPEQQTVTTQDIQHWPLKVDSDTKETGVATIQAGVDTMEIDVKTMGTHVDNRHLAVDYSCAAF